MQPSDCLCRLPPCRSATPCRQPRAAGGEMRMLETTAEQATRYSRLWRKCVVQAAGGRRYRMREL